MIQANELRIGNLIGTYYKQIPIIKISEIKEYVVYGEGYKGISYSSLKPIRLTEEILLKCGFVKEYKYFKVGKRYLYFSESDNIWYLNNSSNLAYCNNIDSVEYLHELQNVYYWSSKDDYIFKREELEINL